MSLINTNEEMNSLPFAEEESSENRLERLRDWERCHGVSFLLGTGGVCLVLVHVVMTARYLGQGSPQVLGIRQLNIFKWPTAQVAVIASLTRDTSSRVSSELLTIPSSHLLRVSSIHPALVTDGEWVHCITLHVFTATGAMVE